MMMNVIIYWNKIKNRKALDISTQEDGQDISIFASISFKVIKERSTQQGKS